jgi:hypothetical protein
VEDGGHGGKGVATGCGRLPPTGHRQIFAEGGSGGRWLGLGFGLHGFGAFQLPVALEAGRGLIVAAGCGQQRCS